MGSASQTTSFCFADYIPDVWAATALMEGCPTDKWEEVLADRLPLPPREVATLVNVGANKGYKIPGFLSRWRNEPEISAQVWYKAILAFAEERKSGQLKWISCGGGCEDCHEPPVAPHRRNRLAMVHALELIPKNAERIVALANSTNVSRMVRVHNLGVSLSLIHI